MDTSRHDLPSLEQYPFTLPLGLGGPSAKPYRHLKMATVGIITLMYSSSRMPFTNSDDIFSSIVSSVVSAAQIAVAASTGWPSQWLLLRRTTLGLGLSKRNSNSSASLKWRPSSATSYEHLKKFNIPLPPDRLIGARRELQPRGPVKHWISTACQVW